MSYTVRSFTRVDNPILPRKVVHRDFGDPSCHKKRKWPIFAQPRAAAVNWSQNRHIFFSWSISNDCYGLISRQHCHGTYIYVAKTTIPVAKDVYIRPTSISCLRICQSPATDVVVVACLRGVFFVSWLFAACSSGPFSLRKQFFYASRGFCPNGGKQRCGCSQMRQAGTSCTFDCFRYDGARGESWFRLVESEGDEWRWIFAGRGN